jgi:hypothetical protein
MRRLSPIPALLLLLLLAACSGGDGGSSDGSSPLAAWTSGPKHVDCAEIGPDTIDAGEAAELARRIQRWHAAKVLEYVDAHPELVCARLGLDMLPPFAWRSWNRSRVVEEVGVAGFVAVRTERPQELLGALFERGAPHGRVLGLAARFGRDALVPWLLEQGVDPASGDALIEAAAAGRLRVVEALLAAGADPDQRPSRGSVLDDGDPTPLFFAIYTRRRDVAQTLLDAGADAEHETTWGRPGHPATLLEWAIFMKLWPLTQRLVEEGADPDDLPRDEQVKLARAARAFHLKPVLAAMGF